MSNAVDFFSDFVTIGKYTRFSLNYTFGWEGMSITHYLTIFFNTQFHGPGAG